VAFANARIRFHNPPSIKSNVDFCSTFRNRVMTVLAYVILLLRQAGYSVERMDNTAFAELGATMRERTLAVEEWLKGLSAAKASRLIKRLKWECRLNRTAQRLKGTGGDEHLT